MPERSSVLSTSELRRPVVIDSAIRTFARSGYLGTSVAQVAVEAKISPAYVFKLFPSKEQLFVAALDHCFELVEQALAAGADSATDATPSVVLEAMGDAYADLIANRSLLMLQVHAQSAADVPEIGEALRRGLERITRFASSRSGASDPEVQSFIAFGQLCHLIVTTGIDGRGEHWARLLTEGIRHPDAS
jgi:AcrR family transcriptional regulator